MFTFQKYFRPGYWTLAYKNNHKKTILKLRDQSKCHISNYLFWRENINSM